MLSSDSTSIISVLLKLNNEPLDDLDQGFIIASRDLMRENCEWTLHLLEGSNDLLGKLYFLTTIQVIFELEVDVVGGACDGPAHAAENLVEGRDVESGAEVAASNQHVANFLQLRRLLILIVYLQHSYF